MIAAAQPVQRPRDAKLLIIDEHGRFSHVPRTRLLDHLRSGDLLIANDAATLPASLAGIHRPTGASIELRLAGADTLAPAAGHRFRAILFGPGDFHTRTEDRLPPPHVTAGDRLLLGPLEAVIERNLGHARLLEVAFVGGPAEVWEGLARHGRPIQYAHMTSPLAMWDVWTSVAGPPVAFEPPSASFVMSWQLVAQLRRRGIAFATLTHAAGISSTGDLLLDRRLPFDEPYRIPDTTAALIRRTRSSGGRVVAVGTTVVRALEDAARGTGSVRSGEGVARERIDRTSRLRTVDAILSGTHEPGTSHYELLHAFTSAQTLDDADRELRAGGYRTHEFGDSVLVFASDHGHPAGYSDLKVNRSASPIGPFW